MRTITLAAVAALSFASPAAAQKSGGTLTFALNSDIRSVELGINRDANTDTVMQILFEGLVAHRADLSVETSDGWRDAGANRFNVAPSLTWLMSDRARVTLHQVFVRDRFDGDGGVPLNIIDLPDFRRDAPYAQTVAREFL